MKIILIIISFLLTVSGASANMSKGNSHGNRHNKFKHHKRVMRKACRAAGITKEKNQDFRKALHNLFQDNKDLRKSLRSARKDYRQTVLSIDAKADLIEAKAVNLGQLRGQLITARRSFVGQATQSLFPNKLRAGLKCVNMKLKLIQMRHKRNGPGKGRGRH